MTNNNSKNSKSAALAYGAPHAPLRVGFLILMILFFVLLAILLMIGVPILHVRLLGGEVHTGSLADWQFTANITMVGILVTGVFVITALRMEESAKYIAWTAVQDVLNDARQRLEDNIKAEADQHLKDNKAEADQHLKDNKAKADQHLAEADQHLKDNKAEADQHLAGIKAAAGRHLEETKARADQQLEGIKAASRQSLEKSLNQVKELGEKVTYFIDASSSENLAKMSDEQIQEKIRNTLYRMIDEETSIKVLIESLRRRVEKNPDQWIFDSVVDRIVKQSAEKITDQTTENILRQARPLGRLLLKAPKEKELQE